MEQNSIVDLEKQERWLEQKALGLGVMRYMDGLKRGEDKSKPGRVLIDRMIPPLTVAIREWIGAAQGGAAARQAGLAHFLSQFDTEDVAFIVARHCLLAFAGEKKLTRVALSLTQQLEEASMSTALRQHDPKAWKRLQTKIDRSPYPNKRYVLIRRESLATRVGSIAWTIAERTRLGIHLVSMCADTSGLFQIKQIRVKDKRQLIIDMEKETLEWLDEAHQRCSLMSPVAMPMVVPPRPWTGIKDGGYLDTRGHRRSIFNGHTTDRAYLQELKHHDMPMVYAAINAVQATPWRINKAVARVLKEVWDSNSTLGGLPSREVLPMPAAPWGDGPKPDKETPEYKAHAAHYARTREANERLVSKRRAMAAKIVVCEEFEKYERIYFPHVMDWRGRIYPLPSFVNPQSDDNGKALVEFAEGVPLGDEGAFWLAVHGANCFGVDKVPFEQRVAWVDENQDAILDSAFNTLDGDRLWTEADDPFMFLAFCFEYAGLTSWVAAGKAQEEFVSHLPVNFDGSCNGLQNFSAMLRDPVGGAATNLVPAFQPADIYQQVADVACARIEKDAANGEVNAVYWRGGKMNRGIAKQPTMTLPYGSGRYGFREQIGAKLEDLKFENNAPYLQGDVFYNSMYAANVILDALGEVVVAARLAMDWLREVSDIMAKINLPIWWKTPAGFLVRQAYHKQDSRTIATYTTGGRRLEVDVRVASDSIDPRKQEQGISPNFVHSLDAAHLMRTVGKCAEAGVTSLSMVHDSYGCHAGSARALNKALRAAFVEQYTGNVLEDFRDQLMRQLPEDVRHTIPPIPPMGDLDLSAVKDSDYFFA